MNPPTKLNPAIITPTKAKTSANPKNMIPIITIMTTIAIVAVKLVLNRAFILFIISIALSYYFEYAIK